MKLPFGLSNISNIFSRRADPVHVATGRSGVEINPQIQTQNSNSSRAQVPNRGQSESRGRILSFNNGNLQNTLHSEWQKVNPADLPQHKSFFSSEDPVWQESVLLGEGPLGNIDEFMDSFLKKSTLNNDKNSDSVPLSKLASITFAGLDQLTLLSPSLFEESSVQTESLRSGQSTTQRSVSISSETKAYSISGETLSSSGSAHFPTLSVQPSSLERSELSESIEFPTLSVQPPSSVRSTLLDQSLPAVAPDMLASLLPKPASNGVPPEMALAPETPKAKHGFKRKFLQFQNPTLKRIRSDIKQTVINSHWDALLRGELVGSNEKMRLKDTLQMHMANQFLGRENNVKVRAYIDKKLAESPVRASYNGLERALFFSKGTNLKHNYLKTENNALFRFSAREKILGKGKQAKVIIAEQIINPQSLDASIKEVAVKVFDSSREANVRAHEEGRLNGERISKLEGTIYQALPHTPHFSSLRDTAVGLDDKSYVFMDLGFGDLNKVMKKIRTEKDPVKREKLKRTLARQCIETVSQMHEKGIYSQDIKPENFLLSNQGHAVITDFGVSGFGDKAINAGTPFYEAPEFNPSSQSQSTKRSKGDLYALGRTLMEIADDDLMSRMMRKNNAVRSIYRGLGGESTHRAELNFVTLRNVGEKLAATSPEDRPDLSEILKHEYFSKNNGLKEVYTPEQLAKFLKNEPNWSN